MTLRHSTIRQLQVFVEAAETLSFARVAERLGLTPAAVSFQIKQIEGLCGFALFERVGRRVVLTEAGAALVEYAAVVLKALTDADERLRELKGLSGGHAKIGLVSTAKYIMPLMLSRFQMTYPGIAIHLQEGNRRDRQQPGQDQSPQHKSPMSPFAAGLSLGLKEVNEERLISEEISGGSWRC